ncbi:MAG: hypothetical protein KF699_05885 [Phycisphaeraceae bacterium]|nr:hypothetical protein [Phycisphaeraceae bacterium]MBX3407865.1 hypothetical protein [Phycisphaeraceae bacterium]
MSPPVNNPSRPPDTGSTFRDRLMYYLFGVALGCVMIGMMFSIRAKMARQEQARREAEAAAAQNPAPNPAAPSHSNPAPAPQP